MEVLVAQLEREAHQLEQDGDDIRAIRMMERALAQRITARMNGSVPAAERLVVKYNTVAVRCFKNDDFEAAQTLLNSALELTSEGSVIFLESDNSRIRLRGTTLNNFGCLERRRGNMAAAAAYLKQSIEHGGQESPASFLNLSAVLTNLGRYTDAVAWCRRAIAMLENEQHQNMVTGADSTTGNENNDQQQQQQKPAPKKSDAPGLMAIAYHNLASPLEQLDRAAAIAAYRRALDIARTEIGQNSSTTRSIQTSLDRFLRMPPAQVTSAGPASQQMQAAQQLAAASGDLNAANNAGKYSKSGASAAPMPGSFLPPVGSSSSSGAKGQNMMMNGRNKAAALAAARKKPDYMTTNRSYASRSQNSTPTYGSNNNTPTKGIRPSPRKLSPLGNRRSGSPPGSAEERERKRSTVATPPKFMTERSTKTSIRERTAQKIAQERDSKRGAEPMARSQDRTHSRTPPPATTRRSRDDLSNDNNNNKPTFSQTARAGKPPRPHSSDRQKSSNNNNNNNSNTVGGRRRQSSPDESVGDRDQQQRRGSSNNRNQHQPAPPPKRGSTVSNNTTTDDRKASTAGSARSNRRESSADTNSKRNNNNNSNKRKDTSADEKPSSKSTRNNNEKQFSRAVAPGSGSGNPVKDLEEEISKKDDIVSFMVARLAALLRAEEDFERCYIAVCRIQCLFRRVRAKTRVENLRKQRELAATYRQARENTAARCLVRFFRFLVAKKQEAILQELRDDEIRVLNSIAASKIQRMSRMWLSRRELMRKRADARLHAKALRVLQCWFRKLLAQRLADRMRDTKKQGEAEKLHFERRDFAASQIQRIFLGRRDALKIHRIRRSMRMLREKEMESRRTSSSKRIQAAWRGFLGRQIAKSKRIAAANLRAKVERWELIQRTVRVLQAWTRGTLSRIRCGPELAVFRRNQEKYRDAYKNNAATKINSLARGFLCRRFVTEALTARTAERRLDWFKSLLPNAQSACRARISVNKVSKKLYASNYRHAELLIECARQHTQFEDEVYMQSFQETVADVETAERKTLFKQARDNWTRVRAEELRDAEKFEEMQRVLAEEAERKRLEDLEIATAAPVGGDRKRPGKQSSEYQIGAEKKFVEIDEEDEDARRIFDAQRLRQEEQDRARGEEEAKSAPVRGPFYDNTTSNNKQSTSSQQQRGSLFVNPQYAENPHRGLSVPLRESIRKQELTKRTRDRLEALKAEEDDRKRVLAEASGMKLSAAQAVDRAGAVLAEPMPEVEKTHVVEEYEKEQEEKKRTSHQQTEEERAIEAAEKAQDFSKLEQFSTAHRDEVLNAMTRRSVAAVQSCLRTLTSLHVADEKAASALENLPDVAAAEGTEVSKEEEISSDNQNEQQQQQQPDSAEAQQRNNAALIIQSHARTARVYMTYNRAMTKILREAILQEMTEAIFQERHFAASSIQTCVRNIQARPQRLANLRRENVRLRATSLADGQQGITETRLEDQVRNYAAGMIQNFCKDCLKSKQATSHTSSDLSRLRDEKQARVKRLEQAWMASSFNFAARIIQLFYRSCVRRLRARRKRRNDIGRRAQLVAGHSFEFERVFAVLMIQHAARKFIYGQRRQKEIALAPRRVFEASRQLDFERNYAVIKMQSATRGYLARKRRTELEGQKARKWAGLLDQEIETEEHQAGVSEDGTTAIMGRDKNADQIDFAAYGDNGEGDNNDNNNSANQQENDAVDEERLQQEAIDQERATATLKLQCAYRTTAAKKRVGVRRDEKKAEWDRMAEEAVTQEAAQEEEQQE